MSGVFADHDHVMRLPLEKNAGNRPLDRSSEFNRWKYVLIVGIKIVPICHIATKKEEKAMISLLK